MSNQIPVFVDPVEEAVRKLVADTHLTNLRTFCPVLELRELQEGDALPVVTCETLDYLVNEDGVNASVGYLITVWDYFPDVEECGSVEEAHMLAVFTTKAYANDLLEITEQLVEKSGTLFPGAEYDHEGKRAIRPRYKTSVFESKVEAKNSPLRDRLIGATVQGRLSGTVPYICCSTSNFEV